MSLSIDERLRIFFASAPQTRYIVPVLEVGHDALPAPFFLWRESASGEVTLENGEVATVLGANFSVKLAGTAQHLDQEFSFSVSTYDIEDEFREALDSIPVDTLVKPYLIFREYLSDDLTEPQTVARLQIEGITYAVGSATLSAVSPRLNINRTGEIYSPRDIPMLRGF